MLKAWRRTREARRSTACKPTAVDLPRSRVLQRPTAKGIGPLALPPQAATTKGTIATEFNGIELRRRSGCMTPAAI